jgi:5-methylcytosine-specific restriction protein A
MSRGRLKTLRSNLRMLKEQSVRVVTPGSWRSGKTTDQRGYTYQWQKFRLWWLAEHPLCGDREDGPSAEHSQCVREGRVSAGTDVDHITPHRGDMDAFWRGPFQTLCARCHSLKTQKESTNG